MGSLKSMMKFIIMLPCGQKNVLLEKLSPGKYWLVKMASNWYFSEFEVVK